MDSREEATADGHHHLATTYNSGSATTTMALQKKRARRVSFAEMTSVHFFDRDEEDNETPVAKAAKVDGVSATELDFGVELEQSKEIDGEDIDVEEMEMPRSFLRPLGSPSPGGSTMGSASSNDEDNFFGPVSASFIRPGRLSDSAASDDTHDVTMDSTAFSMHYRSLARSDSGGDLKTPSVGQLHFEDKTPINANVDSSMVSSSLKKLRPKPFSPKSKLSSSHNSNDMSLIVQNVNRYDYEKLSPGLDALLAESKKNMLSVTATDDVATSQSPKSAENEYLLSLNHRDNTVSLSNYSRKEQDVTYSRDKPNGDASDVGSKLDGPDGIVGSFSPKQLLPNAFDVTARCLSDYRPNSSPYQLSKDEYESPLVLSKSPVRLQRLLTAPSPCKDLENNSSLQEKPDFFLSIENIGHQDTETPIQRSISKLESMEKSSFSSVFSARVDNNTIKTLEFVKSPIDSISCKNCDIFNTDLMKDIVTQEKLANACQSKELKNSSSMVNDSIKSLKHVSDQNHLEEHLDYITSAKSPPSLIAKKLSSVLNYGRIAGSNLKHGSFTKMSCEDALTTKTESLLAEIASTVEKRAIVTPSNDVSSREKILDEKFLAPQGCQLVQPKVLVLQNLAKQSMNSDKDQSVASEEFPVDPNLSTETGKVDVDLEMRASSNLPTSEVNHVKQLIVMEATDGRKTDISNMDNLRGTDTALGKDNKSQVQPNILDRDIKNSTNSSRFADNLAGEEIRAISGGTVSSSPIENLNEVNLLKRSRKFQRGQSNDLGTLECPNHDDMEAMVGRERKHWSNIFSKFSEDTKDLIFGSDYVFDFKMFDVLRDLLVHLHKSKLYEILFTDATPKVSYTSNNHVISTSALKYLQIERTAETHAMLWRIALEKAKLQLNHLRKESLLKRLQLLSSRIQESQLIRTDLPSCSMEMSTFDTQVHCVGYPPLSVDHNERNEQCVRHEKMAAMRSALEASERKISNLNRKLHASCKIGTEPGCGDTIALVNEHFMERAYCRFARLDMQMWVVHSVDNVNYQHNIVLDYLGLVVQSIKVVVRPTASTSFSFEANDTNFMKNFPNMDACTAVKFVFNSKINCKYAGSKTLVREMQVTNSLLGTMLDVFEEVQLAQLEFKNLTESSFCSPSDEQLVLKLRFNNFIAAKKVILELDMSCLKRGIYPSDILPFQIALPTGVQKCSWSELIFDEIEDALKVLEIGYMRIMRLCSCVSQVVQAASSA
ncbi:hypothetical protein F511_05468 [Dorcoceras hygrometricum]|uniref:Uncharacterized protein n=1 Tax=Dorcoceras hygrometricum TaxID=472368 RepID=A0A2Z7B9Y4_9LAMI|nr:hypothetical protein F511_05468 [Dorcoceras hygrometricum]